MKKKKSPVRKRSQERWAVEDRPRGWCRVVRGGESLSPRSWAKSHWKREKIGDKNAPAAFVVVLRR